MKPRNISFAEVLKKKGRSPQPEVSRVGLKLSELLQQWEEYPEEDYTLQLGSIGLSQRSRPSTIKMFSSKNNLEEQEMFDSWIQRQSFVSSNKENIGTQPRRLPEPRQQKKIVLGSKGKEGGKMSARTMGDLVRQAETRQMEESSRGAPCQQVQMIKSNFSDHEPPRISVSRSPRAVKPQEEMQLELEEITVKAPSLKAGKEGLRKELSKITEQKMQETNLIMEERKKMSRVEQLISDNENIHNEIADMAKEIVRQNAYNREESEDEELLIGDSEKKPYMPEPVKREPFFRGERVDRERAERVEKQDDVESRRIQEARNVVGGVLKNFSMGRIGGASNKSSNAVSTDQLRLKPIEQPKAPVIPVHYEVGYSFASNMIDTQRDESLSDLQIQEIKSEVPTPKMEESEDLQFRKKYLNNLNMPVVPDEHIKNIQSIRFETEMHDDAINSMPNSSFEVQLIHSEAKRYEDSYHVEPERQEKPEIVVNLQEDNRGKEAKEATKEQAQPIQTAKLSFTNVFEQNYSSKQPYAKETNPFEKREHISSYTSPKVNELPLLTSGSKYEAKGEDYYKGEPFSTNIEPVSSKRDYEFEHETVEKIVQQMQSPKMEERSETKDVTSPTSFKDIKASSSKYESYNSIKDIKESTPVQANPAFSSISLPKQEEPSPPQISSNYSPTYNQPVPSYLASYNQSSYAQNNYVSSPSNVPSYSSNYSTSTYQTGATYATYEPAKPYASPKTFDYATPTPIPTYTPSTFAPSTYTLSTFTPPTFPSSTSTYQTTKVDYISAPIKTELKPYQQKYSIGSTSVVQAKVQKSDKFEKKNYLTQLDIKQSITLQEPKPKQLPLISKGIKTSLAKPEQLVPPTLFKQSLKQSIKQSINLSASGESEEFQFDF